ncbi:S1/P1 nuclease [Lasiosphaeria miniovina]|uniref:S1/P1 nuclease n=1 Tax=Lasiosphaeria miniovina TaxID=1954250 RepID=A0AA39ZTN9_9PEZI|nr:S1/P1 nuclease [Lasiosphaeria miniovina]KAK0703472.1 S1/P1 nuclease [Lasiosphaeria miniovina]
MKLSPLAVGVVALLPRFATAWGGFGHITVAYVASNFVANSTTAFFQGVLRNDTEDYLAGVATWADSVRYTQWGRFSGPFHFIDAEDNPPHKCGVKLERDCSKQGCIVSAFANYTVRILDGRLPEPEREIAAKFLIHFLGDIHQPLHTEHVARGGNGINVTFGGVKYNLHHVWDVEIPEKIVGGVGKEHPYTEARQWADSLTEEIRSGKFKASSQSWRKGIKFSNPELTSLGWANETNSYVCTTVLPLGPEAIVNQELGTSYYEKAAPVVEAQIAKAGYRLAAWLDLIASKINNQMAGDL